MTKHLSFILATLFVSIIFFSCNTLGDSKKTEEQSTTAAAKTEINFLEGKWQEAKDLAKAQNKLIFLDISASWCGPCKMLKKNTFTDANVAKLFNEKFINVAIDGEVGEGPALAQQYGIQGYPTLLFVDATGNVVNGTMGYLSPEQLLQFANTVVGK